MGTEDTTFFGRNRLLLFILLLLAGLLSAAVMLRSQLVASDEARASAEVASILESITLTAEPTVELTLAATEASATAAAPTEESSSEAEIEQPVYSLADVPTRQVQSLSPSLNPRTFEGKRPSLPDFETYTVVRGDTPVKIAEAFGITSETLLGGNPKLSDEAGLLQVGDELIILPIDGVLHDVGSNDTLESIATLYKVEVAEIVEYEPNNLEFPFRLYADTQILVPGAVREVFQWDPPTLSSTNGGGFWGGQSAPLIVGSGTFVRPVSGGRQTQGYWYGHPAIDIGLLEGSAVVAADTGTVTYASWSPYCYGNLIVVNHGNGFETFYAHLSGFNVVPGQIVYKNDLIGWSGNTGCSSGPHIHIEVRVNGRRDDPNWWIP